MVECVKMSALKVPSTIVFGGALLYLVYYLAFQNVPLNLTPTFPLLSDEAANANNSIDSVKSSRRSSHNNTSYNNIDSDALRMSRHQRILHRTRQKLSELKVAVPGLVTYRSIIDSEISFNESGSDVMVILHIQKTGGTTFEKHIVQDLTLQQPCVCWKRRKRCSCARPTANNLPVNSTALIKKRDRPESWLFSRFSTGWACGLHADWTELSSCVDNQLDQMHGTPVKRRYFYVTMVRDPIHRFLSEFRHVQRGATWKTSRHFCNGRYATVEEIGRCYAGEDWTGVSLDEFLHCPYNLAFNRQTRMLADLTLVGCYNTSYMPTEERNRVLLASAKHNLESMAFVGLTEYQRLSQYVFEEIFKKRFKVPFVQNEETYSKATIDKATDDQLEAVRRKNSLDVELYAYAEQLLHNRFNELRRRDPYFQERYEHLGQEKGFRFSWNDIENEE